MAALTVAAALLVPTAAIAASGTEVYPTDANQRSFNDNDGGWAKGSSSTSLCLPPLTCPSVASRFVSHGGTQGASDGFLRTQIAGLLGVASESRGVLESPTFTYDGVNGKKATDLVARISHLAQVSSLLSVAGNDVQYSFELVDHDTGHAMRLVDEQPLRPESRWTDAPLVRLKPGQMTIGHRYSLRVITRFIYGAEVLEGGGVGYDDIAIVATRDESTLGGDGRGNHGSNDPGNRAVFDGRNLFIKLRCLGVDRKGKCWDRATALKRKGGARYTFPIQRVVNAKQGKVIRARVRFRFRSELERQRSIVLKSVLRTGRHAKHRTTKYTKLRLIKRH